MSLFHMVTNNSKWAWFEPVKIKGQPTEAGKPIALFFAPVTKILKQGRVIFFPDNLRW